ncbi:MBL fold metallo-hydrolase [candidate division GN15 bacterium]|nr:MBL fold metallo-hydrolase [candidate division GN15 bacterium]
MSDNAFVILGCAANRQVSDFDNNVTSGYLLKLGERLILFDCGGGVTGAFLRAGFSFEQVTDIFISHTHADHVTDLPLFVQSIYLTRRTTPGLTLYLPRDFVEPFQNYMRSLYMFPELYPFDFGVVGYGDGFVLDDGLLIEAFGNAHLSRYRERLQQLGGDNEMLSHSFRITTGEKRLFYTADLDRFEEVLPHLPGCDYTVVDSTHVDIDDILEYAATGEIGRVVFTHLGSVSEVRRLQSKIEQSGLSTVTIAEPGMTLQM